MRNSGKSRFPQGKILSCLKILKNIFRYYRSDDSEWGSRKNYRLRLQIEFLQKKNKYKNESPCGFEGEFREKKTESLIVPLPRHDFLSIPTRLQSRGKKA